jgi:hypothetical protein
MKRYILGVLVSFALGISSLDAATMSVSIGVRETNSAGAVFGNGGSANGIEWVNRDGQSLTLDGTWQLFTFTPSTDTLLGFAGTTANSALDFDWGTLEHIRVLNNNGITVPIRLWVDDVTHTDSAGSTVQGFESFATGTEVMFQEPNFSGSTAAFLVLGGTSAVTNSMPHTGAQSYEMKFQFINNVATNWVRLTTSNTPNVPNPRVHLREPGAPAPTISFYAKALVIPEPFSLVLAGLAGLGLLMVRRRTG